MEILPQENLQHILNFLSFDDVINAIATCKKISVLHSTKYYFARRGQQTDTFCIKNATKKEDFGFGVNYYDIYVNDIYGGTLWRDGIEFWMSFSEELLAKFGWEHKNFPFIFPNKLYDKVESRLPNLVIDELAPAYENPKIIIATYNSDERWVYFNRDATATLTQFKMMCYVLKYFKDDIIKEQTLAQDNTCRIF